MSVPLLKQRDSNMYSKAAILATVVCVLLAGCDGLIPTWQTVHLQIANVRTNEPIDRAHVEVAAKPAGSWWVGREQEWIDRFVRGQSPCSDGISVIDLKILVLQAGIVPGLIPGPDLSRDRVKGWPHLVRIRTDHAEETLEVQMQRGAHQRGKVFSVTVLDTGEPRRHLKKNRLEWNSD